MATMIYPIRKRKTPNGKAFRPLPWPLRCMTWLLIGIQAALPVIPQTLYAMEMPRSRTTWAAPDPGPEESSHHAVTINRTLPKITPATPQIHFSSPPTDSEIARAHIFDETLRPDGPTTPQDNQDLGNALMAFLKRAHNDDTTSITIFLATHPQSAWRSSLLTQLGLFYRHTGWYSKALACWDEAWQLTKNTTDPQIRYVADQAVAELLELNAQLGRCTRLEFLFNETQGRVFNGLVSQKIGDAREELWSMKNQPDETFRCGPAALNYIREMTQPGIAPLIATSKSTSQGMSLTEVCDLANQLGMKYQMAKRAPGSAIPLPAVIHWKVGHYAAVTRSENGLYLVQDPSYGSEIWMSQAALDEESSGYFLVQKGKLPRGWSQVESAEGQTVWGKGPTTSSNPNCTKPTDKKNPQCFTQGGAPMAQYAFHAMLVSLNIMDTPVGYTPPRGPDVHFQLTYNQREATQLDPTQYPNLGSKWTYNWFSYIHDNPSLAPANQTVNYYVQGGGMETYTNFNSSTQSYPADPDTHAILQKSSLTNYTRFLSDGSKQIFSFADAPTNAASRHLFLTQIMDASSNAINFIYDNRNRLVNVVDALGQVTTINYNANNDPYGTKIASVSDPFGRTAYFTYDSSDRLVGITDILGIQSQFTYALSDDGTADFINSLTTPYGTTTFTEGVNGRNRWLQATDPLGQQERQEYVDNINSTNITDFGGATPTTIQAGDPAPNYLNYRNSFFWDKNAMQLFPSNYTKAHIDHWLHGSDINTCSGTLESSKNALEDRIWNTYPGQSTSDTYQEGTNNSPATIARLLDDGSSQIFQYQYGGTYNMTTRAYDPTNRVTGFIYDPTNNIDLLETYQMVSATSSNILNRYTYNASHLPLTFIDSSGLTNFYGYNQHGQLTAMTNSLKETISLIYDTNGYLTNLITGVVSNGTYQSTGTNKFTYDAYGRINTTCDTIGYTTAYSYDADDRVTNITYMDGTYQQTVYNELDPILTRDRNGHWTASVYDALQRLTDTYDNAGRHTHFDWCNCGALEDIIDPMGGATLWTRDLQGRVTGKVYPDLSQTSYAYENNTSRLKMVTDANNQSTIYTYLSDNNISQVTYSNTIASTPNVSFTYDTNYNRKITMTDGTGTTTYRYYAVTNGQLGAGRLSSVSNSFIGASSVITYGYDALGRTTNRSLNSASQLLVYDHLGRIVTITNMLGSFTNIYVGSSALISSNLAPFGLKTVYSYWGATNDDRLAQILNLKTNGVTVSSFNYSYDPAGNITNWARQTDNNLPTVSVMQYDPINRLLNSTTFSNTTAGTILSQYAYAYDLSGNRTTEQIGTTTNAPIGISQSGYNNLNQLTNRATSAGAMTFAGYLSRPGTVTIGGYPASVPPSTTNFSGQASVGPGTNVVTITATDYGGHSQTNNYQLVVTNNGVAETIKYDANGNATNIVTATSTNSYQWDAANRLVTTSGPTNQSLFSYDGYGRMVQIIEKTNGIAFATNKFIWDGTQIYEQRNNTGATVARRFFTQGEQISGTNYYFTKDHLGSVREVLTANSLVQARYDYDPYGRRTVVSGSLNADFGYAGYYYHVPSGLCLTLYRAYNPDVGRWLSRDPYGEPAGINLYVYVTDNPVNAVDPHGTFIILALLAVALVVAVGTIYYESKSIQDQSLTSTTDTSDPQQLDKFTQGTAQNITQNVPQLAQDMAYTLNAPESGITPLGPPSDEIGDAAVSAANGAVQSSKDISERYNQAKEWLEKKWHKLHPTVTRVWECSDKTGIYSVTQPSSPGPAWTLVRTINE